MTTLEQKSKLLARWLRHRPDAIGLTLDRHGWTDIAELLAKAAAAEMHITHDELVRVVVENDKQRFSLSPDGLRIRAAQGHSIEVDLKLPFTKPPPVLYHGTVRKFMAAISKHGLIPSSRRDVHLSATKETAEAVGARRGAPVVLSIETYPLVRDGFQFRCADNGVWLISSVPAKYLRLPDESSRTSSLLESTEALRRVGALTSAEVGQLRAIVTRKEKAKK
jgi:putative RNA 2'-phosphotransferase